MIIGTRENTAIQYQRNLGIPQRAQGRPVGKYRSKRHRAIGNTNLGSLSREPSKIRRESMKKIIAPVFILLFLSGCASILETIPISTPCAAGVPYSLPRTVLEFQITIAPVLENAELQFVQATLQAVPKYLGDPDHQYILEHNTSALYDDKLDLGVNERGLLTSLNAKTEDKTLAAIAELSKGIVDFAKLASGLGGFGLESAKSDLDKAFQEAKISLAAQLQRYAGTYTVHAELPESRGSELPPITIFGNQSGWTLDVSLKRIEGDQGEASQEPMQSADGSLDPTERNGGILVRTPQAFLLQMNLHWKGSAMLTKRDEKGSVVTWESNEKAELENRAAAVGLVASKAENESLILELPDPIAHASGIVIVPDYGPIVRIPLDRALFAKAEYKLVFRDGMVATHSVERGNAVVNVAMLPVTIAKEIVKIPAELVQFKIDLTKSEQELKEKQQEIEDKAATRDASKEQEKVAAMKAHVEAETAATLAQSKFKNLSKEGASYENLLSAWSDYLIKAIDSNAKAKVAGQTPIFNLEEIVGQKP